MFNHTDRTAGLEEVIATATQELKGHDAHSAQFATIVDQLTKLHAIQDKKSSNRVSKDTLAVVAGNLAGIVLILHYEQLHPVVSKALSFAGKLK